MKLPIATPAQLRRQGVVGINRRNLRFVQELNKRQHYPLVDDKIRCKSILHEASLATPETLAILNNDHKIQACLQDLAERGEGFVIKPAKGSAGKGIVVIADIVTNSKGRKLFQKPGGRLMSADAISHHLSNVLSGIYSLGDERDRAMLEELIEPGSPFCELAPKGVPDVRILVVCGYPVMAMARLPTLESGGRANLHQGGVGVGVRISDGVMCGGEHLGKFIDEHPDTLRPLCGQSLPGWQDILQLAARCYDLTSIGFLGVDVVIDDSRGPLILELNARPGIGIQVANRMGLHARLEQAREWANQEEAHEDRVARVVAAFDGS